MKYFFLKASPEGTKSPHLNNFLLIPALEGQRIHDRWEREGL
jgi:hypothetical protein